MIANFNDTIRKDYRVYLEPILATACSHQAEKVGVRTMSRYIRRAVIYVEDRWVSFRFCYKKVYKSQCLT